MRDVSGMSAATLAASVVRRGAGREFLLVGLAAATYAGVRAITEGSVAAAVENGGAILELEQRLQLDVEHAVQAAVLPYAALVAVANWIYIFGHWPVIAGTAIVLYRSRREAYYLLRNAMFVSAAIGFLFFALLPVAPPRLLNAGLVDTVVERSTAYRGLQPPALTNQYAALPSLHFGWNLLVGIVLFGISSRLLVRLFALGMPTAMAFSVVATANHFVLDVVVGAVVVLVGLAVARRLERRRVRTLSGNAEPPPRRPPRRRRAPSHVPRRAPSRQRPLPAARGRAVRSGARRG
jgi:hypothetical protein